MPSCAGELCGGRARDCGAVKKVGLPEVGRRSTNPGRDGEQTVAPVCGRPAAAVTGIQFPELTGLRGIAALWVFFHHWNLFSYGSGQGFHGLAVGYLGVDAFFLLSGFVMTHSRYTAFRRFDIGELLIYLAERAARLLPTNIVAMLLYGLMSLLVPSVAEEWPTSVHSGLSFLTSFFLMQSWLPFPLGGWIVPGWSVSVEIGAYCMLPALLPAVRRISSPVWAAILALTALTAFFVILLLHGEKDPNVTVRGGFLRVGCEFVAGSALYQAHALGLKLPGGPTKIITALLLAAALAITVPQAQFLAIPGFALLLLLAAQPSGVGAGVLSQPIPMFLGRISFSLYLVHWPVLVFWKHFGGLSWPALADAAMFAGTLALVTALHFAVEAPSHRVARRLRKYGHGMGALPNHAG